MSQVKKENTCVNYFEKKQFIASTHPGTILENTVEAA
jgi:hypothetical protein